jgi:uncharacterized protein DUF6580
MRTTFSPRFWLALAMVIGGVALRVIPHPWNFAPVGAIALFSGAHFERRRFALLTPLITMFLGDTLLEVVTGHGYHSLMPVIYATYALIAVIGMLLRDWRRSVPAVGGAVLASSIIFYVVTNFAVWLTSPMYAKTIAGLATCYIAAIPYFGNTLASDALFTALLFGIFAVAERAIPLFAPAPFRS